MAKLYYTPTSCGAASFISAFIAGVKLSVDQVDLSTHLTSSGVDFYTINPKGNVPTLVLDDGTVLNENAAILQYIADQAPGVIAPANGTLERAVLQNVLSYLSSEVHANFGPLFNPNLSLEVRNFFVGRLHMKVAYLESTLVADRIFLVGTSFTIADAYLYIILSWSPYVKFDLSAFPKVQNYYNRIATMQNVLNAHARIATTPSSTI